MALGTTRAALIGAVASLVGGRRRGGALAADAARPRARPRAEPGIDLDSARVGAGAAVLIVAATLIGAAASWRATRRSAPAQSTPLQSRGRRRSAADPLARLGCPPSVVSGARFAFTRGHGTASVPVATTLAGAVVAVAVVAAAVTFSQSLRHLIGTPRLYGVNFDYIFWSEGQAGELPLDRRLLARPCPRRRRLGDIDRTVDQRRAGRDARARHYRRRCPADRARGACPSDARRDPARPKDARCARPRDRRPRGSERRQGICSNAHRRKRDRVAAAVGR